MFTPGQVAVMQAEVASTGESYSLTQNNNVCYWPASVANTQGTTAIEIVPNPFSHQININYAEQPLAIRVLNTLGAIVFEINTTSIGTNTTLINTTPLTSGIYYLQVQFKEAMQTHKIIKE